ncbi:unnamed protein product [Closterium sp. NIES-53]
MRIGLRTGMTTMPNNRGTDAAESADADAPGTVRAADAEAAAMPQADAAATEDVLAGASAVADAERSRDGEDADVEADADAGAPDANADAVFFKGEDALEEDDPWCLTDDEVPLLKRKLRHQLRGSTKHTRVVLSGDDSPDEEPQPRLTAAKKGKKNIVEGPTKDHWYKAGSHSDLSKPKSINASSNFRYHCLGACLSP